MSKKYIALVPMVLLLAACSLEAEESIEEPVEETVNAEAEVESAEEAAEGKVWQVASSNEVWNESMLTIEDEELVFESVLPESSITVFTTYELEEEADYYMAQTISKYEVFVPYDENGEVLSEEAAPFQNDHFESKEEEDGILFITENTDIFEEYAYLSPNALHVYEEGEDHREVVIIAETPAVVLAFNLDEEFEENENISALYDSLHHSLLEMSTQGVEAARGSLDEILALTPDSKVAAHHEELINHADRFLQGFINADGEVMQAEVTKIDTVTYSNIYGVYNTYFALQDNLSPYIDIVQSIDGQLDLASGYLDNGQVEDAKNILVKLSGITDILNTYYPGKAEDIASIQTRIQEVGEAQAEPEAVQSQVTFEDFLGYWGNVEAPYAPISPGQEMLYISHNYYSSFVMNSDVGSSGQIQGSSIDGNTLYLDIFIKGFEPDIMYPEGMPDVYQTVALTMHEEDGEKFIVIDIDGFMILYYPVDREEAMYFLNGDMEDNLNGTYQ